LKKIEFHNTSKDSAQQICNKLAHELGKIVYKWARHLPESADSLSRIENNSDIRTQMKSYHMH
jgi:hypothetical protein